MLLVPGPELSRFLRRVPRMAVHAPWYTSRPLRRTVRTHDRGTLAALWLWSLGVGLSTAACATAYVPALVEGQTAFIGIVAPFTYPDEMYLVADVPKTFDVAVHDFADGCPLVESTRRGKGYRGRVKVRLDTPASVVVPAGRRIVLTSVWQRFPMLEKAVWNWCTSVISFVPERGGSYVVRYTEPDTSKLACGATAEKIVTRAGGKRGGTLPEAIAYPRELTGASAFQPGRLCGLRPD